MTAKPTDKGNFQRLVEIMARLRDPKAGCPWDVEQTFRTIAPHTIEEAYEVAEAIERDDMEAMVDELGDLLLQVVFHAQMAREAGHFDVDDVAAAICDKLVRRHPHVFGDLKIDDAETQTRAWEEQKAQERAAKTGGTAAPSALDGVTIGLPGLTRAVKLQKRAARVGFDWDEAAKVLDKFEEEIGELRAELAKRGSSDRIEDELGDLLFNGANLARKLGVDPESALRRCNAKFERRFRRIEAWLAEQGRTPEAATLDEMEALWVRAKREE